MAPALLKSQKNKLFQLVLAHGLDAADFAWEHALDKVTSPFQHGERLVHRPSGYWFFVGKNRQGRYYWFSLDAHEIEARLPEASPGYIELMFGSWLSYLKREYEAPDLWGAVKKQEQVLKAASATDANRNTPFSESELAHIRTQLKSLEQFLFQQAELSGSHRAIVIQRLNYIGEAASRVGRIDWLNLALGVLTNVIVAVALNPQAARELLRLFAVGVHALFGGPPALPQ